MKKFVIRLIVFSGIIGIIIYGLGVEMDKKNYAADYMAAMCDKHSRLDSIKGPRIIFVGGSSTSFGVNSKEVGEAFNIPATNLALVAGLGLDFMLNEAEEKARKGDIIVLSSEIYLFREGDYELKKYTVKCCADAKRYFTENYIKDLTGVRFKQIKNNFAYLAKQLMRRPTPPDTGTNYTDAFTHRTDFNEYGDQIGHIGKRPPAKLFYIADYYPYKYYEGIPRINKFVDAVNKKGAKVYFIYHAYARSAYELNKATIARYSADMKKDLKCPVLGTPEDFVYDDNQFFDTALHLLTEAREVRTKRLIELLKQVI